MPLGKTSNDRLRTCHPSLIRFVECVVAGVDLGDLAPLVTDVTVLCGYRGQRDQEQAFANGSSRKRWPDSKHNISPEALAVDIAPFPLNWNDLRAFAALRQYAQGVAQGMGIAIRVISWDWPHYEILL
jgi:peptidoglycan LD-endopeptidase CwlK